MTFFMVAVFLALLGMLQSFSVIGGSIQVVLAAELTAVVLALTGIGFYIKELVNKNK